MDERALLVLNYLLDSAIGHKKAVPLDVLVDYLGSEGHRVDRRWIQNHVLVPSRSGPMFIGSSRSGVFLIAAHEDYEAMREWYVNRIASEQHHLSVLDATAKQFQTPTNKPMSKQTKYKDLDDVKMEIRRTEVARDRAKEQMLFYRRRHDACLAWVEDAKTRLHANLREAEEMNQKEADQMREMQKAEAALETLKQLLGQAATIPLAFMGDDCGVVG